MNLIRRVLVASALCLSAAASAADSVAAGTWTIDGDVQGHPIHDVCTLTGTDSKLTGTCTIEGHDWGTTGVFDGTTLTLKHAGEYQGEALTLTFSGKLQKSGKWDGNIDVQPLNYQGTFSAAAAAPASAARP